MEIPYSNLVRKLLTSNYKKLCFLHIFRFLANCTLPIISQNMLDNIQPWTLHLVASCLGDSLRQAVQL